MFNENPIAFLLLKQVIYKCIILPFAGKIKRKFQKMRYIVLI